MTAAAHARTVEFFRYANERYAIMLRRRRGEAPPWTTDPVLQAYRFCNIFREDDKTTEWFRDNIREPLRDKSRVIKATLAFRWFGCISTGERIKDILLEEGWNETRVKRALRGVSPILTGAYMVRTPFGMNKVDGICFYMKQFELERAIRKLMVNNLTNSLEEAHAFLVQCPGLGGFMAYEIVTDLNYTGVLDHATDVNRWANPGPGATRGLNYIFKMHWHEGNASHRAIMNVWMRHLLCVSRVLFNGPSWDMRTVEHTLCEFSKYKQGQHGERLKRKYHGRIHEEA